MAGFRFSYKPVTQAQKALVREWIIQEHISEWLHGQGLQNTLDDLEKFPENGSWAYHWIAYDDQTPFAYLITSEIEANLAQASPAITLDLFIGNLNYVGKGLAASMIREFLLSHFSQVEKILIDPEKNNSRAIHVYKKVGFKIIGEFIAEWHPVPHYQMELLMQALV